MKNKKILIVHNYYQTPGGEDTVVQNEKKLLVDNGHEVVLYTRHNDEIKARGILGKLILPIESIFSLKTYLDVKKIIKNENIDVVHVHNTLPLVSPSVYYAAQKCQVPVIQTIHNFRLLCPAGTFTRGNIICEECAKKSLISAIKYKCYRNSLSQSIVSSVTLAIHRLIGTYNMVDGYIALTEFNKKKMGKIVDIKKIYIKPNFSNLNVITSNNILGDYFIFLGRIDELKGIKLLVEAWNEVEKSKLIIVGKGPLEEEVKEYIKLNKLETIEFVGYKQRKEAMKLIEGAKALIVPSQWYEGFPMTIVESLSLGVPVIAGNIGNLSTIIKDRDNGLLFKYNNKNDLVDKINEIENNELLLKQLREGSIKIYNENYNEEINYNLLMNIYEDCTRRK